MEINSTGSVYYFEVSTGYENHSQTRVEACTEAAQDLLAALQSTALETQPLQPYHFLNPEVLKRLSSSNTDLAGCDDVQQAGITSISEGDRQGQGFTDQSDKTPLELLQDSTSPWPSLYKLAQSLLKQTGCRIYPSNALPPGYLIEPNAYFAIRSLI